MMEHTSIVNNYTLHMQPSVSKEIFYIRSDNRMEKLASVCVREKLVVAVVMIYLEKYVRFLFCFYLKNLKIILKM